MEPYLRFVVELPEGEPVELFVPELPGTKRNYVYEAHSRPTNMTHDPTGSGILADWATELDCAD